MKNKRFGQAAILDDSDYSKIRKNIIDQKYKILLDIAWYTGERWGAIVQTKVSDIYDENGNWDKVQSSWRSGETKTIRVPKKLAPQILEFARLLDARISPIEDKITKFLSLKKRQSRYKNIHRSTPRWRFLMNLKDGLKVICENSKLLFNNTKENYSQ